MGTHKLTRRAFVGAGILSAGALMLTDPLVAFADTSAEKQAEADAVSAKLADWQNQLNIASDNYYAALDEHEAALAAMDEAQGRIDAANATIAQLQGHLGNRANAMYKTGNASFVEVLLGATSFTQFINTWDTLNTLNQQDADWVSQNKAAKKEAQDAHDEYTRQEQIAADKLAEAERIQTEAEGIVAQYQAELDGLNAEVAALVAAEQQAAMEAQAAANQAAEASSSDGSSSSGGSSSSDGSSSSGGSRPDGSYGSVVSAAESRVGCSYVWGAEGPSSFDCSGLVKWCYAKVGISLAHSSGSQGFVGATYPISQAQPGDICWMSGHVGIYVGGGQTIEAMDTAHGVCYGNAYRFSHATHP